MPRQRRPGAGRVARKGAEPMAGEDCLFCKIVAGAVPSDMVRDDEWTVAFRDIDPQAPTHVLVVPREHIPSVAALEQDQAELVGRLFLAAAEVARQEGIAASGYRLVLNEGRDALQSVAHVHLHVLGGRRLGWPPG